MRGARPMPHSAQATTPLGRAIAIATAENFVILPSHARGRLDVNGERDGAEQRVLCGTLDGHGRFICGEHIASVGPRGWDIVASDMPCVLAKPVFIISRWSLDTAPATDRMWPPQMR